MNVLSLFDGISCGQQALQRLGIKVDQYFASEIEKPSIEITQHNFPGTIQLGDVTKVTGEGLPKIDLIIAGSPCQSFSPTISSNTGFDGKSKLFFEFVRLLKELQPKYFFLENVVMKKEWEQVITNHLGVEPVFVNSELFSAQSRPRLYWTNIPTAELPKKDELAHLVLGDILEENVSEKYFYNQDFKFHGDDKVVCATLDIKGHDILKRVNSKFHKCQTLTAVCGGNQQKKVIDGGRVRKLTPLEYERLQTISDNYTAIGLNGKQISDGARYKALGNCWNVDTIAHFFGGLK